MAILQMCNTLINLGFAQKGYNPVLNIFIYIIASNESVVYTFLNIEIIFIFLDRLAFIL
jgi:hypothetical protein